jgi:CubicO group peptidase (beta-lactamase class C family)
VFTNRGDSLHEVRSISKLIISLCLGIAIESKFYSIDNEPLSLNSHIWSTLSDKVDLKNSSNRSYLEKLTIKNLLTQTIGYVNEDLLFSNSLKNKNIEKLLDFVINEPILFEPGQYFSYSNASAYILSAFFQELSGENIYKYSQRVLFKPLNILSHSWLNYGQYCAGATGLFLKVEDLHKIGKLMLNNGVYENKQILSEKFISEMTKGHVKIDDPKWSTHSLSPYSYGFFIWINYNFYYISGARGQYLVIYPSKKLVVSIISNQEDSIQLIECIKEILLTS